MTADCTIETSLMSIAGFDAMVISATATAVRQSGSGACLYALNKSDKESVYLNSDSAIVAPKCRVQINSNSNEALIGNSNGDITSKSTCVVGSYKKDGTSDFLPTPVNCPALDDPLASLPVPASATSSCNFTDKTVTGTATLNPGVYCKKLELNAGAKVTFNPGVYVIRDGEFIVNSLSSATGNGVMFYLTGTNNPRFNINSNSHIEFRAPTTGTYAGIVFFQQRGSTADFSILNSDSTSYVEGVIYLPSTPLHLNSYGSLSASTPWTVVVADKVVVNSQSTLRLNADYKSSSVPLPKGLGNGGAEGIVRLTN